MTPLAGHSVGVVGMGLMGRPMALNLFRAGAKVAIASRSPGPVRKLAEVGLMGLDCPARVAEAAEVVILAVSDTPAVEQAVLGPDGVLQGLAPGGLVIDMGTTEVAATRRLAERVAAAGGSFIDAPVSGGTVAAEAGNLIIMAGGEAEAIARARPILEVLGERFTHLGPAGAGQVAKAANQVIVGLTIGAVAEALALARAAGVDPALVREAIMGGFADSRILALHGARMVTDRFEPGGKVTTQHKDLDQALALAAQSGIELPATALTRDHYARLIERGLGELDHSALYKLFGDTAD
ncbi:NAD(P)-dependent oxidoreductase [Roseospirillum parvum]|uniref:3-hydroxyisobutyrate dehydrogenase n=1 Tax=Roseospirillum parvum TaxID=83401 RepID=A0A1G8BDG2_9PROT|nr:NAD(P)-dependent oxidoreductase [Roseospirillum parvum]SDH31104.1 3-hydroxyisobutyrate dehydrogenase [Roseospirillum parvum]